ncbi:hypothetical protein [Microvirga sp. Mcv34]|uniref:hypothetical protein n=1 Tax=Microvirga sp. Mcv34 TaxID=2926016 RepID=UPI0021C7894F|nr:hypothetical protein [Microvirga sp. Mcv34]
MTPSMHPSAPHSLPIFISSPGGTDYLMVGMGIFLVAFVLAVGLLYMRLHHLPDHIAHKSQKIQYEIVAVLGLLAMFTHIHAFWVAGLLLALIDLPDFGTPLGRISGALEKLAADRRRRAVSGVGGERPEAPGTLFLPRSPAPPGRDRERFTGASEASNQSPFDEMTQPR